MLIPPLNVPAWSHQRCRQAEASGFSKLWFSPSPMGIGTGDFRVQWVGCSARIFLTNLDVFPCETKGHSVFQPKWFGLFRNPSDVLESSGTSPREPIADMSPQFGFSDFILVAWNLSRWEYLHHGNGRMLQIQAPHYPSRLFSTSTQRKLFSPLTCSQPHLWAV